MELSQSQALQVSGHSNVAGGGGLEIESDKPIISSYIANKKSCCLNKCIQMFQS